MGRLTDSADVLLAANDTDLLARLDAYSRLLWEVVTSTREELGELVARMYEEPYIYLPPPLQVAAFRLWGLEPPDDAKRLQAAAMGIALYCSQGEEQAACAGLRERQRTVARNSN